MASAALNTVRSGTCLPATLIVVPGKWPPDGGAWLVRGFDGEAFGLSDDAPARGDRLAPPDPTEGDEDPPTAFGNGLCVNIAEIITATRAAIRQPASSGS